MKRFARFTVFVAVLSGTAAHAQSPAGSWTASTSVVSQYMFRGLRFGGPSLQPMVEYDRGALAAGVWASTPLANRVPGQSDPEIDPFVSYKIAVGDSFSVQPGATLYLFPRAEPSTGFYRSTFEPNLALNYTTHGITLTPKLYYDVVLRGPTYELNAAYALPVKDIGSELDFYASVGRYEWEAGVAQTTPRTRMTGNYWNVTVALPFQISARAKITASVGYAEGWDSTFRQSGFATQRNTQAVGRVVATLGYSVTF